MRKFCNRFFVEFGDSYTLLDVYNISKKVELAHAHYEVSTIATLTLGSDQSKGLQGCRPRGKLESVGECENEHSHSKVSSHFASWSPGGLLNL